MISFAEAYQRTLENILPLSEEHVPLLEATGRVVSRTLKASVWSPSADSSLKDGFAVRSADVRDAAPGHEVRLTIVGSVAAGGDWEGELKNGQAVRILSGAPVPDGAQAVLAEEFTQENGEELIAFNTAEPGRNILPKGEDVAKGQKLVEAGEMLHPTRVGYLASAGFAEVPVIRNPKVGIIATGDEVVAPGKPLDEGKLYASNLVTLASWCRRFGFSVETDVLPDKRRALKEGLGRALEAYDAVLTSGGAWKGDRDLVAEVLTDLGWEKIFHRVKMGPGKAVGLGMVGAKPVFCLPGGPPSNHMAFLQLALPGLMRLAGWEKLGLPTTPVVLQQDVRGQAEWTQFIHGRIEETPEKVLFTPVKLKSRLQMLATSDAVIKIPEGVRLISKGARVPADLLF